MEVGINLSYDLVRMPTGEHLPPWDYRFDAWIVGVKAEIQKQGYYTESVEFGRAGEKGEPVSGIYGFPK